MACRYLCNKIMAILIFVCLIVSLATCLISILSTAWWVGDFEAVGGVKNVSRIPNNYEIHLLFDLTFGLTRVCWRVHQARLYNDPLPAPLINTTKKCITELPEEPLARELIERDMAPFQHILISLIIAVILIFIGLLFAFINLPCIYCSRKVVYLSATFVFTICAGVCNMAGLIIANEKLHYGAGFMKTLVKYAPVETESPFAQKFLQKVLYAFSRTNLSDKFHKGYSFDFGCATEVFLVLAVILMIFQFCCCPYYKENKNEYKSELISDAYVERENTDI